MQDKVSWTLNMTKNQSSLHIENKFQRPDLPLLGIEPRSPGSQIQHFINGAERKIPQDNSCSCVSKPHHVLLNISAYINTFIFKQHSKRYSLFWKSSTLITSGGKTYD